MKQEKSRKAASSADSWTDFQRTSNRFEKQRVACDTGLAFVFTEGALVEAIRSGKWYVISPQIIVDYRAKFETHDTMITGYF